MKKFLIICLVPLLFSFRGCIESEIIPTLKVSPCNASTANIVTETELVGTVGQVIGGVWIINVENKGKKVRCVPCNLPDGFKQTDVPIKFDASFLTIPPNVRLIGQPIEIKRIY